MAKPKHRRRADKRPDEILDAALSCFMELGYAATRVEDIAERAGISKAAVYLYFESKQALIEGLVGRELAPIPDQAALAIASFPGPVRDILRQVMQIIATRISDPKTIAIPLLVLRESVTFPELADTYREQVLNKALPIMQSLIQKGVESGEFRQIDPEQALRSIMGPVMVHIVLANVFGVGKSDEESMQKMLTAHFEILMQGLEAR